MLCAVCCIPRAAHLIMRTHIVCRVLHTLHLALCTSCCVPPHAAAAGRRPKQLRKCRLVFRADGPLLTKAVALRPKERLALDRKGARKRWGRERSTKKEKGLCRRARLGRKEGEKMYLYLDNASVYANGKVDKKRILCLISEKGLRVCRMVCTGLL